MNHDLDYGDLDDEGPDTLTTAFRKEVRKVNMRPTLHEIPLGSGQELDEEPGQHLVLERTSPVTISAEEKTNMVTGLNFLLDEIYILQTTVENILLTVDRGG